MPPQGNSRYLELLKAVTRSLEVKLRLKALDLAATLSIWHRSTRESGGTQNICSKVHQVWFIST